MSKLRIGIIGAGTISTRHLKNYKQNPWVELRAICDVNEQTASNRATEFEIPNVYTDPMNILADPNIDAVSIVTPTFTHKNLVLAALEHGKHVLCEKPPALNAQEAALCEAAAAQSGKVLMYGFVLRFSKETAFLKDYIDSGAMGKIYYTEAVRTNRHFRINGWFVDKQKSGGGPLIDSVIHELDTVLYLLGYPDVHSVKGFTSHEIGALPYQLRGIKDGWKSADIHSYKTEVESLAGALLRFRDGTTLYLKTSWVLNTCRPGKLVELCGTKAGAELTSDGIRLVQVDNSGYYMESAPALTANVDHFAGEIDHFVDCCLGKASCICKPSEGTRIMQIIDAIYHSAETGKEIVF